MDLCAAPGSWSQVLSQRLYQGEKGTEEASDRPVAEETRWGENKDQDKKDERSEANDVREDVTGEAGASAGSPDVELVKDGAGSSKQSTGACRSEEEADKLEGPDSGAKIVAVDLQLMAPLPGVVQIHGDITKVRCGTRVSIVR